jgi:hypothetical protein
MIQDYLNHLNNGSTVYKLKPYGEEKFNGARLAFIECCKSIVPNWKDVSPATTDQLVRYCVQSDKFKGDLSKGIILNGKHGSRKDGLLKST